MIITEYEQPFYSYELIDGLFKANVCYGIIEDTDWCTKTEAPTLAGCLMKAEAKWEAKKKSLYGPNTYVETVRNGSHIEVDKYRTEE